MDKKYTRSEFIKLSNEEKKTLLAKSNDFYRTGNPIVDDATYEEYVDMLDDPQGFRDVQIKFSMSDDGRKQKLPMPMFSLNKMREIDEFNKWGKTKNITNEDMIITPKFDGCSFLIQHGVENAWTRGDGEIGQYSSTHWDMIGNNPKIDKGHSFYVWGEVMMPFEVFDRKYKGPYKNSRNMVAGLLNSKEATDPLKDCVFVAYGTNANDLKTKEDQLDFLNKTYNKKYKVEYLKIKWKDITTSLLQDCFKKWSNNFWLDGIVIETNQLHTERESNNNPCYARAFKFESQRKVTKVISIEWNVNKFGNLIPVCNLNPIELSGSTVQRVTANNARFVKVNNIGVGSEVLIEKSGEIIPKILEVDGKEIV